MGDEPYTAVLPWVDFAVIDRAQGDPLWAGVGALVTALTLLVTSTREPGRRNVVMLGAVVWFGGHRRRRHLNRTNTGFLAHDGRAIRPPDSR